jgi:hypothetical protein
MKNLIRKILQEQEEIITLPPFHYFDNDWNLVLELSEGKPFKIMGNVDLSNNQEITTLGNCYAVAGYLNLYNCINLESLGNLTEVGGYLDLRETNIQSLESLTVVGGWLDLYNCKNHQSLGNLTEVGGWINLQKCKNLQSLGNLTEVGNDLYIWETPIAKTMTEYEIRQQVNVNGDIYFEFYVKF